MQNELKFFLKYLLGMWSKAIEMPVDTSGVTAKDRMYLQRQDEDMKIIGVSGQAHYVYFTHRLPMSPLKSVACQLRSHSSRKLLWMITATAHVSRLCKCCARQWQSDDPVSHSHDPFIAIDGMAVLEVCHHLVKYMDF